MDAQNELEQARLWRAQREQQIEREQWAQESNEQADRAIDMLGVYGIAFICALIMCALGLAFYADKLG